MLILTLTIGLLVLLRLPLTLHIASFGDVKGMDALAHRIFLRLTYKRKGRLQDVSVPQFLFDAGQKTGISYPLGYYAMLRGLGWTVSTFDRFGQYLSLVWDALLIVSIFLAISHQGGHTAWILLLPFQQIFTEHLGRAYHHSERAFSPLLCNLFAWSTIGIMQNGFTLPWMLMGSASFLIASVSSKFAWQALVLLPSVVSLLLLDPLPFLWMLGCASLSVLLTGGYSAHVLYRSLLYLRFYRKHMAQRTGRHAITHYKKLRGLFTYPIAGRWNEWNLLFFENPIVSIITLLPLGIPAFDAVLRGVHTTPAITWWYAGMILVFLVSFRALAHIGTPIRYLECAVLPLCLWLSSVSPLQVSPVSLIACGIVSAISTVHFLRFWWKKYDVSLSRETADEAMAVRFLLERIKESSRLPVLLSTLPRFCLKIYLETDRCCFVSYISGIHESLVQEVLAFVPQNFDHVSSDLKRWVDTYQVDYLIIDRLYEKELLEADGESPYPQKPGTIIFKNPSIEIRHIEQSS